jgi:hypothetical protein
MLPPAVLQVSVLASDIPHSVLTALRPVFCLPQRPSPNHVNVGLKARKASREGTDVITTKLT